MRLLGQATPETALPALLPLASGAGGQALRLTAIEAIGRFDDPRIGDAVLGDIGRQTPAVRRASLSVCCAKTSLATRLLDAVQRGEIAASCLGAEHWRLLAGLSDTRIRDRAERLREAAVPDDRRRVIEAYAATLAISGDPSRGRGIFARECAGCHRVDGVGVHVGPDISDARLKRPEQFLVDILDPNRAIDSGSFACTVLLDDGRCFTGLVAAETGGSITLRQAEGATVTLLRDQIEDLNTSSVSLMPVGLERSISVPQMADLISFLKGWRHGP
ncbi:MAG: hypothetical protein EBZ59_02245 [Planctomycetia bacterium]|nr:hypothetical protein [Planctomycetia bacterium]